MSLSQTASTEPEIGLKRCGLFLLFFVIFIHLFLTCFMFIVKHLVHVTLCCKKWHFLHGRIYTNRFYYYFAQKQVYFYTTLLYTTLIISPVSRSMSSDCNILFGGSRYARILCTISAMNLKLGSDMLCHDPVASMHRSAPNAGCW